MLSIILKLKLKQDSWFSSHLGHCLPRGNLTRHLPQVFACYNLITNSSLYFYRNITMSEFEFFMEREDRWEDNMKILWGSLSVCPLMTCIRLPHHTAEELDSISHLKIWGNTQSPHQNMAYLLVQINDTPNAKIYSMALVWVSLLQTKVSSVVEALEILTTFALKDPTGHTSSSNCMKVPTTCPSRRTNILVFYARSRWEVQAGR